MTGPSINPLALAIASTTVTAMALSLAAICVADTARSTGQPGLVVGAAALFAAFVLWRAIKLYQAIAADLAKRDA